MKLNSVPTVLRQSLIHQAIKRIKEREIIKTKRKPSAFKICMELRKLSRELDLDPCPQFPKSETIDYQKESTLQNTKDAIAIKSGINQ
jgi:hypothetical protein